MRALALLLMFGSLALSADWKVGLNFRGTSGYVTDGADEVYVLGETSSTERKTTNGNSVTFCWTGAPGVVDRNSGLDQRLAGINYTENGSQRTLVVTLPQPGVYLVRVALGDGGYNQWLQYAQLQDDETPLVTVNDEDGTGAANFDDATGVNRTAAAWPADNASREVTFNTTVCRLVIGHPTTSLSASTIAHLYLEFIKGLSARRRQAVLVQ